MSADSPSTPSNPEPLPRAESSQPPPQKRRYRQNEGEGPGLHDQQVALLSTLLANLMRKGPVEEPAKEIHRFRGKASAATPVPPAPAAVAAPSAPVEVPLRPAAGENAPRPSPVVARSGGDRDYTKYADEVATEEIVVAPPAASMEPADSAVKSAPPSIETPLPAANKPATSESWPFLPRAAEAPATAGSGRFFYWMLVLLIGIGAFAAGRWTSGNGFLPSPNSSAAPEAPPPLTWTLENLKRLNRILEADQSGDLDMAGQLADSLQESAGPLPGLASYLALLVARHQKFADAQSSLSRMLSPAVEGARYALTADALAFTYTRQRRFPLASQTFEQAALAEPFGAETFRLWAESLRREGHFEQAVAVFREALVRYPVGSAASVPVREYVEYEVRLAQIEGNLAVDTRTPASDAMATADSNGYWFMTDAASAIQRGNDEAAVTVLQQAKGALPASLFDQLIGDYFFRAHVSDPKIAAFFPANHDAVARELRSRMVYFIDP